MSLAVRRQFCFWLIPAEPLKQRLSAIIKKLTVDWDAGEFDPHVTIYNSQSIETDAKSITQRMARTFPPFALNALGLDHSDQFSKTLFVQFTGSPELRRMSEMIKASCAQSAPYEVNPHLSLLYKKMPPAERARLCQNLAAPEGTYLFDAVRAVAMEIPFTDPKQTGTWQTICGEKFSA